jgi:hypothetical protein
MKEEPENGRKRERFVKIVFESESEKISILGAIFVARHLNID